MGTGKVKEGALSHGMVVPIKVKEGILPATRTVVPEEGSPGKGWPRQGQGGRPPCRAGAPPGREAPARSRNAPSPPHERLSPTPPRPPFPRRPLPKGGPEIDEFVCRRMPGPLETLGLTDRRRGDKGGPVVEIFPYLAFGGTVDNVEGILGDSTRFCSNNVDNPRS